MAKEKCRYRNYSTSYFKKIFRENAEVNVYCSFTVSRDFRGLHMILMDRTKVPGVPLDVIFLNSCFYIVF